jgi:hypothetical protein
MSLASLSWRSPFVLLDLAISGPKSGLLIAGVGGSGFLDAVIDPDALLVRGDPARLGRAGLPEGRPRGANVLLIALADEAKRPRPATASKEIVNNVNAPHVPI